MKGMRGSPIKTNSFTRPSETTGNDTSPRSLRFGGHYVYRRYLLFPDTVGFTVVPLCSLFMSLVNYRP